MNTLAKRGSRTERATVILAFLALFPGFFFYHALVGTGTMSAFIGGYFSPVALLFLLPIACIYLRQIRRDRHCFARSELHFGIFITYFTVVVAANATTGANITIVTEHVLGIMFLVITFILFKTTEFAHPAFRYPALLSLFAMSAIAFAFSIDGVFYLGAQGTAITPESLATYQGFARSYLITFLAVIPYTRALALRVLLYASGAATLYVNSARSEFVALLFAIPIIEFYFARQKLLFIFVLASLAALFTVNFDLVLQRLPDSRILELLNLSQSTSASIRHHLTAHALQTISSYPIFGDYASYPPGYYSHNILSAWVDLGIFGFLYLIAIVMLPAIPLLMREYFSARDHGDFVLCLALASVTILLLYTSHYFTDMLIGATLGAYSKFNYGRKYVKHRASDLGPSAPRYPHLRQTVP